jgi:hypothetical protein
LQWIDEKVLERICSRIGRAEIFRESRKIKALIDLIVRRGQTIKRKSTERRESNLKLIIFLFYANYF